MSGRINRRHKQKRGRYLKCDWKSEVIPQYEPDSGVTWQQQKYGQQKSNSHGSKTEASKTNYVIYQFENIFKLASLNIYDMKFKPFMSLLQCLFFHSLTHKHRLHSQNTL